MTKNFCDIYGEAAYAGHASLVKPLNAMAWSGTKCSAGSPNPTDGNWTPHIHAVVNFHISNLKRKTEDHVPDLCIGCVYSLLADLLLKLRVKLPKAQDFEPI